MAFQGDSIFWVEVEKVVPNPFQPRREFDEAKLQELAESVRMYGILQPLTVSRKEVIREDGTFYTEYELIAGERRLRASKLAGLAQVPVIIREGEDSEQEKLELAIIENLQREDLNAVDRALAFRQLADTFGLSHAQVAKKVGRSREYVSNSIRLLGLPDYMLTSLKQGDISEGHARTLLMLNDRPEELDTVYREILLKKLSVREVERIVRKIATDKVRKKHWQGTDPELMEIERQFNEALGTRVQIQKTDYGGKLTIDYFSQDDLEQMLTLLRKREAAAAAATAATAASAADTLREHTGLDPINPVAPLPSPIADESYAEPDQPSTLEAAPAGEEESTPAMPAEETPLTAPWAVAAQAVNPPVPPAPPATPVSHAPVTLEPVAPLTPASAPDGAVPPSEAASQPHASVPAVPPPDDLALRPQQALTPAPTPPVPAPAAPVTPAAAAEATAAPTPTPTPPQPTDEAAASAPVTSPPAAPQHDQAAADESDLYSVRHFGI